MVGATALQICTAVMIKGFDIVTNMLEELEVFMNRRGFNRLEDFRGQSLNYIVNNYYELNSKPMVAAVNMDSCRKCLECVVACADGSSGAISSLDDHIDIDKNTCIGCGLCATVCPHGAIDLVISN
jgi:dihydropyrimidine dehydrogenase (NAD+) subunit PreA